jgi:four helix bundle protein
MAGAKSFRELAVYRLARREALRVMRMSQKFPPDEQASLAEPMRQAARSVAAHIADAWGRRANPAGFSACIVHAMGAATSVRAWLDHAKDAGYLADQTHESADAAWDQVARMLQTMYESADEFCGIPIDR